MTPAATRAVTLRDVAERAGVSTAATSQALNDRGNLRPETRARIKAVAAELGYSPNRSAAALRGGRTMSVGFVMSDTPEDDAAERRALRRTRQLNALVRASAAHGFAVTVLPDSRPDLVQRAQIDVLYFPDPADDRAVLREAVTRGVPVVANDLYIAGAAGLSIRTGYDSAVRAALALLADAGAERIGLLVDESEVPRDQIGESAYLAWTAVRSRTPIVARVDPGRRRLAREVRTLLDAGADAIFSFCEEGPEIYLQLEATGRVIPRDLQLVALCTTDCALNDRLGITHVCVHPELAAETMFARLGEVSGSEPRVIDLPWEIVRGSTTR
ncbi:LacI family DNA-binding transcriptional regulator [Microbacterium memoriense]|uniref:LacI family transcriptional regulator n=1 Tax=Microbacterium memoriense TaxID=2978350 RepID=A0ABT2P8L5_9MICO|nr:LacI family DNA-binding transcriptional regulator [Microbacterium memoriense]MCT9000947.1 LacI family transcriptional regulator [Microbacterium memoriense]